MPILKREPDAFPEGIFEIDQPWWVAHLRSRQEKVFARYLQQHAIAYYLPQMEKKVRRNGRTIVSYLPLFSGYVFFRGGATEGGRAVRSHLIANLLEPRDQGELSSELRQLHELQVTERKLVPFPYIGAGDRVMITDGAFLQRVPWRRCQGTRLGAPRRVGIVHPAKRCSGAGSRIHPSTREL